jgi:hypothetical protein
MGDLDWIQPAQYRDLWRAVVNIVMNGRYFLNLPVCQG